MGNNCYEEIEYVSGLLCADADSIANAATELTACERVEFRAELLISTVSMTKHLERLLELLT